MKYSIITLFIFVSSQLFAQFASYNFNANAQDGINTFHGTQIGTTQFKTDDGSQVLELDGDGYLTLPPALSGNINAEEGFQYTIRFKMTEPYNSNPFNGQTGEGLRVLVTNKDWDQRGGGFNLYVGEYGEGALRLLASYGDGNYDNFGQLDFVNEELEIGEWYTVTVKMVLNVARPYIQYIVNGTLSTSYIELEAFDFQIFKNILSSKQIWVGTDTDNEASFVAPFGRVSIDELSFYSPFPPGNPNTINTILNDLIQHLNGTNTLTDNQQDALFVDFLNNWDENSFTPNEAVIFDYLSTFSSTEGTVFDESLDLLSIADFSVTKNIQYIMEQWIMDNLYTPDNVPNMAGLSFLDHTLFPGAVSQNAPRVTNATFIIDGTYQTNPGFMLNDQAFVIRPTGYFAPAGELVTITLPPAVIGKGLKVRVGAHYQNLETTWNVFNRFPRMGAEFSVENTSLTVVNPFGGAIYITMPDGTNLGAINGQISGAVKAPYYCTKPGFETALSTYQNDLANNYVPWTDWESENFMLTFPTATARELTNSNTILAQYDACFDVFNVLAGRPLTRFRGEYVLQDKQNHNAFTIPASYPMSFPVGDFFIPELEGVPNIITDAEIFTRDGGTSTLFHEMGHLHNLPTLFDEVETIAELYAPAVYNIVFDVPMSEAVSRSSNSRLTLDEGALDWILPPTFRLGHRILKDTFLHPIDDPFDTQLRYQVRGFAKYVDIADIFSWDTLGLINGHFYEEALGNPDFDYYDISDDTYLRAASEELNVNMLPLFEFWGILPSSSLVNELSTFPQDNRIRDRLLHYRSIVPSDAQAFQTVYTTITDKIEEGHLIRYDKMLNSYNSSTADSITARIDFILCKYFDEDCTNPTEPETCTEEEITISTITKPLYHATETITSTANFNTGTITFKAGNVITLQPGFHAESGATFHALIAECTSSAPATSSTTNSVLNSSAASIGTKFSGHIGKCTSTHHPVFSYHTVSKPPATATHYTASPTRSKVVKLSISAAAEMQIFPNPLSHAGTIRLQINEPTNATIELLDLNGRLVKELYNGSIIKGWNEFSIQSSNLPSGLYFVAFTAPKERLIQKLVIE